MSINNQKDKNWEKFIDDEDRKQRQERGEMEEHGNSEKQEIEKPFEEKEILNEPIINKIKRFFRRQGKKFPIKTSSMTNVRKPSNKKVQSIRKNKKKKLNKKLWFKRIAILCAVLFGLGVISMVGVFAWFSKDLPDPDKILERDVALSTKIYDRSGEHILYEIHGDEKRTFVSIDDIPEYVQHATVSIEDQSFYQHHGVDLTGILRAFVSNITQGGRGQGGSTITQQFIKNAILTKEKTYTRKIKEAVLSYQMETRFTKDQILQMYLNEIPYGSNAYGIESASQAFFAKSAKDLELSEAALLAALPQAPSYYSPYGSHTDRLVVRQQYVLDQMASLGYITQEEADFAKEDDILSRIQPKRENIEAAHFVFYIKEKLTEKYGDKTVEQGGLKIITTLDYDKQKIAEEVVASGVEKYVEPRGGSNAALVSIDAHTGQVLAMVGSRDYFDTENDGNVNVTLSQRQPGSSLKPLVYMSSWEKGYTPETTLFDLETDFETGTDSYHPRNYDLSQRGPVSMQMALQGSLNIPAVKALYLAGVNHVLDNAEKLGYTTLKDRDRYGLSLVLGGGEVTLLEHTHAYATFAREGEKHELATILRVEDKNGDVLEEYNDHAEQVIESKYARLLNSVLSDDNERSYVFGHGSALTLPGRQVAAKTGTTNDYRDGWTVGYTPSISTGVWAGNNDNTPMNRGAGGLTVAAPIWQEYMKRITEGLPQETFKSPDADSVEKDMLKGEFETKTTVKVDRVTGKQIPDDCLNYPSEFIEEKEIKETHTILHYVNKDDPRGDIPTDPSQDPQYNNWESAVKKWSEENGYITEGLEQEQCGLRDDSQKPQVSITTPSNGAVLDDQTFEVVVSISSPRNIKKVEYHIDDVLVDTQTTANWQTDYTARNLTNGFHTLSVKVYDDIENTAETSIDFQYDIKDAITTLNFLSPEFGSVQTAGSEMAISARAYNPIGLQSVKMLVYKLSEGRHSSFTVEDFGKPKSDTLSTTWTVGSKNGEYRIYMTAVDNNGEQTTSDDFVVYVQGGTDDASTTEDTGKSDGSQSRDPIFPNAPWN